MNTEEQICPEWQRISRSGYADIDAARDAHLGDCSACRAEWLQLGRLIHLARELAAKPPDELRADQVRTALLVRAAARNSSIRLLVRKRGGSLLAAALVAAIVAILLAIGASMHRETPSAPVAWMTSVYAEADARWQRLGTPGDEMVRISEGRATFEVPRLAPGQRFRVVTGDAEVEVHGTAFEVVAARDRLERVNVLRGRVEVRPFNRLARLLAAGESWTPDRVGTEAHALTAPAESSAGAADSAVARSEPSVDAALGDRPAAKTEAKRVPVVKPAATSLATAELARGETSPSAALPPAAASSTGGLDESAPDGAELRFREGWQALRRGDAVRASEAFDAAASAGSSLSEDATFWRAVSLLRAERLGQARRALETFLARYPMSPRAGEASVLLGKVLMRFGERSAAENRFRAAERDPSPVIRRAARSGLGLKETKPPGTH